MALTTTEQLEALSPGATVRVQDSSGRHDWTVTESGTLERSGVRLPPKMFATLLANGRVEDTAHLAPEVGMLYRGQRRSYTYLMVGKEGDRYRFLRFRNGEYLRVQSYTAEQCGVLTLIPPEDRPEWYRPVWQVTHAYEAEREQQQRLYRDLTRQLDQVSQQLVELRSR